MNTPAAERTPVSAVTREAEPTTLVAGWRRRLQLAALLRALLAGLGAGALALATSRPLLVGTSVAEQGGRVAAGSALSGGGIAMLVAGFVALAVAGSQWWRSAVRSLSTERAALWLEEQAPRLRFALVSALGDDVSPAVRPALARAIHAVPWEQAARRAFWRSLRAPALVAFGGVAAAVLVPVGLGAARSSVARDRPGAGAPGAPTPLGSVTLTLQPPTYTGLSTAREVDPALVRAYPGSRALMTGRGPVVSTHAVLDSAPLAVREAPGGWQAGFTTGASRALVRLQRDGGDARLLALEPLVDSAPSVALRAPARDTILRVPRGTMPLAADIQDDLGIASASFEYIVSSGEGERFTFKSGTLGALPAETGRRGTLHAVLSLEGLQLAPGDVVHLRAVGRDRNNVSGPGIGSSESRTIRIARADEYDSVAVDQAPPPEVDESVLSQRMLINMTEALVKRARSIAKSDVTVESRRIGRDQARLRKQVSDIIFARLGDGAEGEGHDHDESESPASGSLTPEALLKAAEKATEINGHPTDFAGDETPVVAINRPMLEAFNAMWEAGRALDGGEPKRALPPMYAALAAIQRARTAERLYLRGAPPRVVVDLARIRMQGKDKGTPDLRRPRAPLDPFHREALRRFAAALTTLEQTPTAGVDSLIVLRLAVADRRPAAATALEGAITELRASRDATALLLLVRRALDDDIVSVDTLSRWGSVR
ncbi:MAG: hypothetical protein ABI910_01895 [Gemmatimonadota bacterium]